MTQFVRDKLHLKLYLQYETLANHYACKIFNYERYCYEKEDIIQELRIKIYNCINTYLKRYLEYKETGRYKPVPLEYYLKTAMINRTKDFIKLFNQETVESIDKVSIQDNSYDEGIYRDLDYELSSHIELGKCICVVNNVDIFYGLNDRKKQCFALFLKGFSQTKLKRMFRDFSVNPETLSIRFIEEQITY